MTLLDVQELTLSLGGQTGHALLKGMSLTVEAGETVGLVGESGSGKSLTARAVLGLLPHASVSGGRVLLEGTDMLTASDDVAMGRRRATVSMVFQDPRSGINPVRRIGDYVTESLRLTSGWPADRATTRAIELLTSVGLPDPERHLRQYPHELSGGMLQRVMIAAALATEPDLLLCDEPTTALDVTTQAEIIGILTEQQSLRGMGMLFITHDLNLAAAICDRVYVVRGGEIVESGAATAVFTSPQDAYTRQLIDATPSLDVQEVGEVRAPASPAETVLTVSGLSKTYRTKHGDVPAVSEVSFSVARGQAFGLVGESGSGKSTIARMLVGLEVPDSGRIELLGADIGIPVRGAAARIARAKARQIVFQDPYLSLDPRVPIGKAIEDVLRLHSPEQRSTHAARVTELLDQVGLVARQAESLPRNLSGGQRQRAGIAKALAVSPQLLVLDEATSALDVSVQAQILDLLRQIRAEEGLALVFVSHDLAVVQQLCEQTLVLKRGRAVEQGATRDLLSRPTQAYTRLLIDSVPRAGWDLSALLAARRSQDDTEDDRL